MKKNSVWLKPWKIMLIVLAFLLVPLLQKWSFLYFLYTCNNFEPPIILIQRTLSFNEAVKYSNGLVYP